MLKVLYINAIMSEASGESMKQGLIDGLRRSKAAQIHGVEVEAYDIFYGKQRYPRFMGEWLRDHKYDAVVLSGCEKNTSDLDDPWLAEYYTGLKDLLDIRPGREDEWDGPPVPVLGICFAHQAFAAALGGETARVGMKVGVETIKLLPQADRHPVFRTLSKREANFVVYHGDQVVRMPRGFHVCMTSEYCPVQAMAHDRWPIFSMQPHPEMNASIKDASDDKETWEAVPRSAFETNDGPQVLAAFLDWVVSRL